MPTAEIDLPAFSSIRIANVEPVLRELLDAHRAQLAALLVQPEPSWDSLVVPLEEMQHRLSRTWSPVGHLNGVLNSDELRAAYNACLPLLTAWNTDLAQNEQLYRAYETIVFERGRQVVEPGNASCWENALRDFRLAGVALPDRAKESLQGIDGAVGDPAIEVRRERTRCNECLVEAHHRLNARFAGLPNTDRRTREAK